MSRPASVAGIRIEGASSVLFVGASGMSIPAGSRISVRTSDGEARALVIVSPDQLAGTSPESVEIAGVIESGDDGHVAVLRQGVEVQHSPALGAATGGPSSGDDEPSIHALVAEYERRGPRVGGRVSIKGSEGWIVAIDQATGMAQIELDDGSVVEERTDAAE